MLNIKYRQILFMFQKFRNEKFIHILYYFFVFYIGKIMFIDIVKIIIIINNLQNSMPLGLKKMDVKYKCETFNMKNFMYEIVYAYCI